VAPYPANNTLTPEQKELLRGRYQGTAPDSFPSYLPAQVSMPDTAKAALPVDSLAADSMKVDSAAAAKAAPAAPAAAMPTAAPATGVKKP
jgi:hypothetical protein